jgi:F420-non-reducing hydrogenase large subunit
MAAAKAADAVYKVTPPPAGRKLRELLYNAFYVTDHATHFYVLSGPDLIMGPDAPAAERNILGVVKKVGAEVGKQVIDVRHAGHRVIEIIGGRRIHPCTGVPGGMTKAISEAERQEIETLGQQMVDFAGFSLDLFDKMFAEDGAVEELVTGDLYRHQTYYAGLVDANDKVTFYDGRVKVVAPDGEIFGSYEPKDYRDWIAEKVEPWTFLKFPYLKGVGWKGLVDAGLGHYTVAPAGRLNVASGMAATRPGRL